MPCPGQNLRYTLFKGTVIMFALCVDLRITKIDQAVCQLELRVVATMTGTWCLVCGNSQSKDSDASFHRFPSDLGRRAIWLRVFDFQESDIKPHHRVCPRHFPNGDWGKALPRLSRKALEPRGRKDEKLRSNSLMLSLPVNKLLLLPRGWYTYPPAQ